VPDVRGPSLRISAPATPCPRRAALPARRRAAGVGRRPSGGRAHLGQGRELAVRDLQTAVTWSSPAVRWVDSRTVRPRVTRSSRARPRRSVSGSRCAVRLVEDEDVRIGEQRPREPAAAGAARRTPARRRHRPGCPSRRAARAPRRADPARRDLVELGVGRPRPADPQVLRREAANRWSSCRHPDTSGGTAAAGRSVSGTVRLPSVEPDGAGPRASRRSAAATSVDLPEPLGPTTARRDPAERADTSSSTGPPTWPSTAVGHERDGRRGGSGPAGSGTGTGARAAPHPTGPLPRAGERGPAGASPATGSTAGRRQGDDSGGIRTDGPAQAASTSTASAPVAAHGGAAQPVHARRVRTRLLVERPHRAASYAWTPCTHSSVADSTQATPPGPAPRDGGGARPSRAVPPTPLAARTTQ
jgi:hypothetical protein